MPTSAELIALFASHHARHLSDKTLNNWLAGLHFWHIINGAEWKADDKLHHVWRGFAKLVPPSSKHAKHALLNHCTGSLGLPSHAPLFVFRTPTGTLEISGFPRILASN
ncbi:hypothetical protein M404DRAFT_999436 [Pisolithus tinctorius Marx 270]|uniref:Uncharacterized protein n=1 Tax=Pisolithus tinctorius Marx 270 TaxID=870435 RepID=A0A0C3K9D7_PISTI|nr:hypothetical protein M404DRAFT_999436 [Pisolithus tinctorius Marx 270]